MGTILDILDFIEWVSDPCRHFLLAFTAGVSVYALTSIMYYAFSLVWERLTRRQISSAVDSYMVISLFLLAISVAVASHWALDFLYTWYTTPLGPPLILVTPEVIP
jgi:hypothetical protein